MPNRPAEVTTRWVRPEEPPLVPRSMWPYRLNHLPVAVVNAGYKLAKANWPKASASQLMSHLRPTPDGAIIVR